MASLKHCVTIADAIVKKQAVMVHWLDGTLTQGTIHKINEEFAWVAYPDGKTTACVPLEQIICKSEVLPFIFGE